MPIIISVIDERHFLKGIVTTEWDSESMIDPGVAIATNRNKDQQIDGFDDIIRMEKSFTKPGAELFQSVREFHL